MTPESFAALGARLMLMRRLCWPPHLVAALPDYTVKAIAALLVNGGAR